MDYAVPADVLRTSPKVFHHRVGDQVVVVKQDTQSRGTLFHGLQRLAYRLTKMPLLAPTLLSPGVSRTAFEAGRLETYFRAGLKVPKVLYVGDTYFVMTDVGSNLDWVLPGLKDDAQRNLLVEQAIGALGSLHNAGFAHGGAQIRNFALKDGVVSLFDFEEDTQNAHLEDMQIRDLILLILSLIHRLGDMSPDWVCGVYDGDTSGKTFRKLGESLRRFRWVKAVDALLPGRIRAGDLRKFAGLIRRIEHDERTPG